MVLKMRKEKTDYENVFRAQNDDIMKLTDLNENL